MEDIERRLITFIRNSEEASKILSRLRSLEIVPDDIQFALMENDETEEEADLLEKDYSADQMIAILRDFNFQKYHPEILAEFEMDEPVFPAGIPRLLTEATVKHKGERWRIHKSDADPFPSNPHAHCLDRVQTLDLSTGNLYEKRRLVKNIGKKGLRAIRDKALKCGCDSLPELA